MKQGEIVCWQMLLYPKPIYGREDTYRVRIKFTDKKYLYTQSGGLFEPIAYWRVKKSKIHPPINNRSNISYPPLCQFIKPMNFVSFPQNVENN